VERRDEGAAAPNALVTRVSSTIALGVLVVAGVGVIVGTLGRPGLVLDLRHPLPIHSGSALACLLLSLALLGWLGTLPLGRGARHACLALALAVASSSTVGLSTTLHDRAVDLVGHTRLHTHGVPLLTGICVLLLAIAIFGREHEWSIALTDSLASLAFAVSAFALFSWGIGKSDAIALGHEDPPLFIGGLALAALALAVVAADPARDGLGSLLGRSDGGGTVLRRFVPVALLVPLGLEVARHRLEDALDVDLVATGQVFATAVVLVAFVVWGAFRLDRSERELRAAREAAFMSTMSHELRTPLIAIRNLAEVIDHSWDDVADEQRREAVRATLEQSTRLLDLLHDTWQLRRLDAGTLPVLAEGVRLRDAMRAAVAERGIHASIECPGDLRVWMDPEHLRLMLGACLRLAQRSGPGPKALHAIARQQEACVYVEVPSRGGQAASPPADTGWSLWTIAQLARQWGGEASFERVDDERSRFVVTLPLAARIPR
jgi:signal transduction histidine kinase